MYGAVRRGGARHSDQTGPAVVLPARRARASLRATSSIMIEFLGGLRRIGRMTPIDQTVAVDQGDVHADLDEAQMKIEVLAEAKRLIEAPGPVDQSTPIQARHENFRLMLAVQRHV
jgi:hypothetical protein